MLNFQSLITIYVHFLCSFFKFFVWFFSILGGFLVIIGLYLLLWGKASDQDYKNSQQQSSPTHIEQKECRTHRDTSSAEHELS